MNKHIKKALIILFWIVVWGAIALCIGNSVILASPVEVLQTFGGAIVTPEFWVTVGASLLRVLIGFVTACIIGCGLAVLSYKFKTFYDFVLPLIQFIKSAPIVCFIVLLLVWVGAFYVDVITIIISVVPIYFFAIYQACQNRNMTIADMLQVFQVPPKTIWRTFEWPNALPYFKQATESGIGIAWKSGVTAQMIGAVAYTIGQGVYSAKLSLDSAELLLWMFVVVFLGWMCEKLVITIVNHRTRSIMSRVQSSFTSKIITERQNPPDPKTTTETSTPQKAQEETLLTLENITKSFGGKKVLDNVNLTIHSGERISLTSPTGSGKTTLIKIILGLEKPDSGRVRIDTNETLSQDPQTRTFSAVFQETALLDNFNVHSNIEIAAQMPVSSEKTNALIPSKLMPSELSGGMKRCAEIERAMLANSKVVVLDEPFVGLDSHKKNQAQEYILNNLDGRALILVTHDTDDAINLGCTQFGF